MLNLDQLSSITQVESGEKLSSIVFHQKILEKAHILKSSYGIGPGTSVLLLQNNSIAFFVNLLAVLKLGATAIPLDPNSSNLEIEKIKSYSSVSLVIDKVGETFIALKYFKKQEGIALILYTSGTTGSPKGVMISFKSLNEKMRVLAREISSSERLRTMCALPTFFGHGLICNSLFPLFYGKHFFIANKFDLLLVRDLSKILNKYEITFFSTVPSVWELILNFSSNDLLIPSLQRVHCASSPLSNSKAIAIKSWLGPKVRFYNIYGITEMLGWVGSRLIELNSTTNEFNSFWSVEHVINKSNNEMFLKSEYMFSGYLDKDVEYAESVNEEGFFRTGDIFENGELKGRLKNVINKKGFKVYPQDIDQFIFSSDLVNDVHTFSITDHFSNELIGVVVSLKKGSTVDSLREYCMANLPAIKIPDKFFVQDKIIRNSRGKISKEFTAQLVKDNLIDEK
jgi:acyl-CoA synthetase (AMP-forming)/AMP-acid ligase II